MTFISITIIVEFKKIVVENGKEKKRTSKYERIVYPLACYNIFSSGMYVFPENSILLAIVIGIV